MPTLETRLLPDKLEHFSEGVMTLPRLQYIAIGAPLAIATGLVVVWIAKPSGATGLTVPRGTSVQIRLGQSLASNQSRPGDQFDGILAKPVLVKDKVAIPVDAQIEGKVVDGCPSGKLAGPARLRLTLNSIKIKGKIYELHTTDVAQYGSGLVKGNCELAGSEADRAAVPGAVAGSGKGMRIGAPVGDSAGAAATGVPGGKNVRMPAETPLKFRLIEPLVLPHKK
jgi:hypothetical protein